MSDKLEEKIEEYIECAIDEAIEERESRGYSLEGELTLSCRYCNKPLVSIIIVKQTKDENKFKANCPYCQGESFVKKIVGKMYYAPCGDLTIYDIVMGEKITELKLKK
jgi:aspartate carbamoyltransferase regulatory subunit